MAIENGSEVKVHYTGMFESGEIFDSSHGRDPLEFVVGSGMVIKGFEDEIIGLNVGDKKTFKIASDNAYGPVREDLIFQVQRSVLPEGVEVGELLEVHQPDGNVFVVRVDGLTDETATLNANHPLAGKDLVFEVEIIEIN